MLNSDVQNRQHIFSSQQIRQTLEYMLVGIEPIVGAFSGFAAIVSAIPLIPAALPIQDITNKTFSLQWLWKVGIIRSYIRTISSIMPKWNNRATIGEAEEGSSNDSIETH